jgi:hypothetical protein
MLYGRQALMDDIKAAVNGQNQTNTWNITVNGADDPEVWATKFAHQFKMQMRMA